MTHITSKDKTHDPIISPGGEIIYELVGSSSESGAAKLHSLAHVVIPPGKSSTPHYHKICEETYYLLRGEGRMIIDEDQSVLTAGDTILILPGQAHQIFCSGQKNLEFLAVCSPAWSQDDSYNI